LLVFNFLRNDQLLDLFSMMCNTWILYRTTSYWHLSRTKWTTSFEIWHGTRIYFLHPAGFCGSHKGTGFLPV